MFFIPYSTREDEPRQRFPVVTLLFVLFNVAAFLYEAYLLAMYGESGLAQFIQTYAVIPAQISDGSPLEPGLLTSMFLHAGLLHIVGNMLFLMPFGDNVEDRLGHGRYIFFYLLCGVAASLVHVAFYPNSVIPTLGASGAVAGVLGGYLALHPRGVVRGFLFFIILLMRVELPAILFIGYWFIVQLFSGIASLGVTTNESGGVAFMAHVGGFIAGLILAPLLAFTVRRKSHRHHSYQYN